MARRARIDDNAGQAAFRAACDAPSAPRKVQGTAVRYTLQQLEDLAPGRSVELRVPPFGAVQCVAGGTHTRGTPRAVVETDAESWLALVSGQQTWNDLTASGKLTASGERSDLADAVAKLAAFMA